MKPITLLASICCGVALTSLQVDGAQEPFFEGLGSHTRIITTTSPEAQKYFNQGLNFLFGFNHGAAIRAFQAAETIDPDCAMAHWGVALACGPHINFPMVPPPAAELAWKELALAREHVAQTSAVEQALIEARKQPRTSVVVVETDYNERVSGYESWWDVPIAEVSEVESVRASYRSYAEAKKKEKYFL